MPTPEWSVLVADDEPAARRGVRQLLAAHSHFRVVAECRNGREVLDALDALRPHVVFLDVQMPGIDGLEVIRRARPQGMPAVVFLTAYDEFAVAAFDVDAVDYLLKPVTESRFAATMSRLSRHLGRGTVSAQDTRFVIKTGRGATLLPEKNVDWIESADNYVRIWVGAKSFLVRDSLDALEERLGKLGFVRVHRQALVRLDAIQAVRHARPSPVVQLCSGQRIPVARRRLAALRRALRLRDV